MYNKSLRNEVIGKALSNNAQITSAQNSQCNWAKGSLKRGFYSAIQAFYAANLALLMMTPSSRRIYGENHRYQVNDKLLTKISDLEKKIKNFDIEPKKPSYLKSGISFLLFNSTYLLPVIAIGVSAALVTSPLLALLTTALVNTHAQMGEALVNTLRKKSKGKNVCDKDGLVEALQNRSLRKSINVNTSIMGAVCLAVTLAAGPMARLLGGFTSGAFSSLSKTPVGVYVTEKTVRSIHKNAVKSLRKPLGKAFSNAAEHGPGYVAAKVNTSAAFARVSVSGLLTKIFYRAKFKKTADAQDKGLEDIKAFNRNNYLPWI
jgi:hypothetical protein